MKQSNIIEYKGYYTVVRFDAESKTLRGKIEGINDYVDFQSTSLDEVVHDFQIAVDDYLLFCEEVGKTPEKEYKGAFNVRIKPELHKRLVEYSDRMGETLNSTVQKAIESYLAS